MGLVNPDRSGIGFGLPGDSLSRGALLAFESIVCLQVNVRDKDLDWVPATDRSIRDFSIFGAGGN
jgi:hypothetical protein